MRFSIDKFLQICEVLSIPKTKGVRRVEEVEFLKKESRSVRIVKERARFVLVIQEDESVEIIRNERYTLNVIAIIGLDYSGWVLLEEIGIFRTKPFRPSQIGRIGRAKEKFGGKIIYCPKREKEGDLIPEQYQLVAPIVFRILQGIVDKRPNQKRLIRTTVIKQRSGRIIAKKEIMEWQKGWKFSILKDSLFCSDIFWAELNLNAGVKKYMEILASSIAACLSGYSVTSLQSKNCHKLKGYQLARMKFQNCRISRHLLLEIFNYLPKMNHFENSVVELLGWKGDKSEEKILSEQNLPNPEERLSGIQIRTFGTRKGFLIFEVYSKQW